jgi:hypothetical protein
VAGLVVNKYDSVTAFNAAYTPLTFQPMGIIGRPICLVIERGGGNLTFCIYVPEEIRFEVLTVADNDFLANIDRVGFYTEAGDAGFSCYTTLYSWVCWDWTE